MFTLDLLGGADLRDASGAERRPVLAQPKRVALLAWLALARPRGPHRRDRVVALFWPEADQERGRRALRDAVYFLRRELAEEAIAGRGAEEIGLGDGLFAVDVLRFEACLAAGDDVGALACYRGELLPGFHIDDAPEFGHWLDEERERLARAAREAARRLRDARGADEVAWASRAAELAPWEEGDAAALVDALARRGDRAAALETAERFAMRLRDEVGLAPGARLAAAVAEARRQVPAAATEVAATAPSGAAAAAAPAVPPPRAAVASRRRRGGRWLALPVLLVLAAAVWWRWRPAPAAGDVMVLPFVVHGGADTHYLADGMVDLLSATLDGAGGLRVVDPQALMAAVHEEGAPRDLAAARRFASRFGGAWFVMGSVVEAGGRMQVTAYLYDAAGREAARADGLAARDSLLPLVDDLARGLLAGRLDAPDADAARLAARTTTSLPALRAWLAGERALRAGDFVTALDDFRRATTLDTTFALAYYRQSSAADWLGRPGEAHDAIEDAARHRGRLDPFARMLVEARMHFWLGDAAEAERAYNQLLALRPTSVEVWYEYAEVLFHGGPWMGRSMLLAEPALRRVLALTPGHASALLHLSRIAALRHDRALVDSLAAAMTAREPGHARLAEVRLFQIALRDDAARLAEGRAALDAVDVTSRAMAVDRMAVFTGDRRTALAYTLPLTADGVLEFPRRAGLEIGAHLAASLGQWALADSLLTRLGRADPLRAAQARALAVLGAAPRSDRALADASRRALLATPVERYGADADPELRLFVDLRQAFYLGALDDRLGDSAGVTRALARLDAGGREADVDRGAYARHAAGLLRALVARGRGDHAAALVALRASWPPPRRALMVRWAWNHTAVLARVERAEAALATGQREEARQWHDAAIEDIAGTPLLQPRLDALAAALGVRPR